MEYFRTLDDNKARLEQFRREAADFRLARSARRGRREARRGLPGAR